jgi:hypothetical protein
MYGSFWMSEIRRFLRVSCVCFAFSSLMGVIITLLARALPPVHLSTYRELLCIHLATYPPIFLLFYGMLDNMVFSLFYGKV